MPVLLDLLFNEWLVGFGVPILVGIGLSLLADEFKEFTAARICFIFATLWAYGKMIMWGFTTPESFKVRALVIALVSASVAIGLVEALRLTTRRQTTVNATPDSVKEPFSVTVETCLFSTTFQQGGIFWVVDRFGPRRSKAPINAVLAVRVVNNQSIASMINRLTLEGNTVNGKWIPLLLIRGDMVQLFDVINNDFTKAGLLTPIMLDSMLENRAMSPNETVKGFLMLAYPRGNDQFNGKFRFAIADTGGAKYSQQEADTNAGNFGGNSLPGGGFQDISKYPTAFVQDSPANLITPP